MDMLTIFYLCLLAIYTSGDADKQPKQGRGRGSIWWWVFPSLSHVKPHGSSNKAQFLKQSANKKFN